MALLKILVTGVFIKVHLDDKDRKPSTKINTLENDANNVLLPWTTNFHPHPFFLKNLICRHNMLSHSIIVRNLACLTSQHDYFAAMLLCREQHFYLHEEKNPEI